jgi:hypothetical protein
MPDIIVSKQLLCFRITIPYAEHLIFILRDIWPFRLLAFRGSEKVLQGSSFGEPGDFLSAIQKSLTRVDSETLDAIFQKQMIRLQKCIDGNSEYVE